MFIFQSMENNTLLHLKEPAPSVSMNDLSSNSQLATSQYINDRGAECISADHVCSSNQEEAKKLFNTGSRYFYPSLKGYTTAEGKDLVKLLGPKVRKVPLE